MFELDTPAIDSTRFRLLYWLDSASDKQLHYGRSIRKLCDPYCSHSANKNRPSPTVLVSSRRSDGWAAAIGRWEWGVGGLLGVKSKRHAWLLGCLRCQPGPSVTPGELTARRGATRMQRPSLLRERRSALQLPCPRSADPAHWAVRAEECASVRASQLR